MRRRRRPSSPRSPCRSPVAGRAAQCANDVQLRVQLDAVVGLFEYRRHGSHRGLGERYYPPVETARGLPSQRTKLPRRSDSGQGDEIDRTLRQPRRSRAPRIRRAGPPPLCRPDSRHLKVVAPMGIVELTSVPHFQDHASDNWGPEGAGSDGVVNRSWSGRRSNMLSWSTCSICVKAPRQTA